MNNQSLPIKAKAVPEQTAGTALKKTKIMEKRTIYIGGKVTGEDYKQCVKKFKATQDTLEGFGFKVINPMNYVPEGTSWLNAMEILIPLLKQANYLFLLRDWKDSQGARIEVQVAKRNGVDVVFYEQINEMQWY